MVLTGKKLNIIFLPFSGASIYSYNAFKKYLPDEFGFIPLELPGRGSRVYEPLLTDLNDMASDIIRQIKDIVSFPYAIFGHSMGTLIALLVTQRLIAHRLPEPLHLFMTGRYGPGIMKDEPPNHTLPEKEFREKLREMGGSPESFFEDDELMNFFGPILRADFRAVDDYRYAPSTPFNIPITVMIGTEEKITEEEALAWQAETLHPVCLKWFPGRHFFIFDHVQEIAGLMVKTLHEALAKHNGNL